MFTTFVTARLQSATCRPQLALAVLRCAQFADTRASEQHNHYRTHRAHSSPAHGTMGLSFSCTCLFEKLFGRKEAKILVLGVDNAGKTTLLVHLKIGELVHTKPTIGFNVETLEYRNIKLTCFDIGGQKRIRDTTRARAMNHWWTYEYVLEEEKHRNVVQTVGAAKYAPAATSQQGMRLPYAAPKKIAEQKLTRKCNSKTGKTSQTSVLRKGAESTLYPKEHALHERKNTERQTRAQEKKGQENIAKGKEGIRNTQTSFTNKSAGPQRWP